MKNKEKKAKLELKKITIVTLNNLDMNKINGGCGVDTSPITPPVTRKCPGEE